MHHFDITTVYTSAKLPYADTKRSGGEVKIKKIGIRNFRGIKHLDWDLPDERIVCLIGKGDSAKTTILEAIRCAFHPQWNLSFNDSDFHLCDVNEPIDITVVFGEIPNEFYSIQKYGSFLQGWDKATSKLNDEPDDHDEIVLSAHLTVGRDLEPKWRITTTRNIDGVDFRASDRAKLNVAIIGSYSEKQLTWAAGSALARITESDNLTESLVDASRAARRSLDDERENALPNFDAAATKSEVVARGLGVPVDQNYKAHLDTASINIRVGGLSLHDGEIPLRQLGLGSRRMLMCGIQKENLQKNHVTLFDEFEIGLEPHRIARLVKHIKDDETGQYFITTHSPSVLRELSTCNLHIVHRLANNVTVVHTDSPILSELNVQGHIRSSAEAFLSKKIIVCEGATEVGFLRGLDNYWLRQKLNAFSYLGTAILDAKGASKVKGLATAFKTLGYQVCVVADGDAPKQFSEKDCQDLEIDGVSVLMWAEQLSLEQRAMFDLPWNCVQASLKLAKESGYPVHDNVRSKLDIAQPQEFSEWQNSLDLRRAIGDAAKSSAWFKSITGGEDWVDVVAEAFADGEFLFSDLGKKLLQVRAWADHD